MNGETNQSTQFKFDLQTNATSNTSGVISSNADERAAAMASRGEARRAAFDAAARAEHWRSTYAGLSAYERHQRLLQQLAPYAAGGGPDDAAAATNAAAAAAALAAGTRTDADALREAHRFLRRPEDDAPQTWETKLARRYYARLFREYAVADLSRAARDGAVGLRWRTQAEVESGKGQFVCGARGCGAAAGLASYEVLFAYAEAGERRSALVKVRACPACAAKLAAARGGGSGSGSGSGAAGKRRERSHKHKRERERSRGRSRSRSCSRSDSERRQRRQRRHKRDSKRRHRRSRSASGSDDSSSSGGGGSSSSSSSSSSSDGERGKGSRRRDNRGSGRRSSPATERGNNRGGATGSRGRNGGAERPPPSDRRAEPTEADIDNFLDEMFV